MTDDVSDENRRKVPRFAVTLEVILNVGGGGRTLQGHSIDVSESGIFVEVEEPISEGRRIDLVIRCPEPPIIIATSGLVVHVLDKRGVGIKFSRQSERTQQLLQTMLSDAPRKT